MNKRDIYLKLIAKLKPAIPAEVLAKKWKVDIKVINAALDKGQKVEREHTDSDSEARRIASHHIYEMLEYYDKLSKMEKHAAHEHLIWMRVQVIGMSGFLADKARYAVLDALKNGGYRVKEGPAGYGDYVYFVEPKTVPMDGLDNKALENDMSVLSSLPIYVHSRKRSYPLKDMAIISPEAR